MYLTTDRNCLWCPAAIFWERIQLVQSRQWFCSTDGWAAAAHSSETSACWWLQCNIHCSVRYSGVILSALQCSEPWQARLSLCTDTCSPAWTEAVGHISALAKLRRKCKILHDHTLVFGMTWVGDGGRGVWPLWVTTSISSTLLHPGDFPLHHSYPQLCSAFLGKKPKVDWLYFTRPLDKSPAQFRDRAEVKFKLTPTVACTMTKSWAWLPDSVDRKGCLFAGLWWVHGPSDFLGSGTKPPRVQDTFGQYFQAHGVIPWFDLGRVRS